MFALSERPNMSKKVVISSYVSKEIADELSRRKKQEGQNISWLIEKALRELFQMK